MFSVGKLFHLGHLVEDLDAVDRWYDDIFGCVRYYRGYERAARRDASLLVISDMCMEPIMPSSDPDDAGWPLQKFKARFGNRLHSIAWYVDDIKACSAHLLDQGIRQVGLTGKPVTDPTKAVAIWTHPKDTHALLEFCEPNFAPDPRLDPGWSAQSWADEHPLRIQRTAYLTVLFERLEDAAAVYVDALDGTVLATVEEPGVKRASYIAVGEETVIEAVQPLDPTTPEGRDLAATGEGVHAIVFATADLPGASAFLIDKGQRLEDGGPDRFFVDQDDSFGLRVGFTSAPVPNDQRS